MTLNGVMALTLLTLSFNEFGKPAFQLKTAFSSIELFDQKSASVTHIAVKLVCLTKFTHLLWSEFQRYLLVIYGLSFALLL